MIVEIVSYINGLSDNVRLKLTKNLINSSTADILLFSGHTVGFVNDIETLRLSIDNYHTEVIFELEDINSDKINNCLYRISKGILINMFTNQLFTRSIDIENNYELASRLLYELKHNRSFKVKGFKIIIIQCGEINILKNIQSEDNRVEFRLVNDKKLMNQFTEILHDSKIILNPIHTPMGNQGKMNKRREYFSLDNRYYFSTSNSKENSSKLDMKSLQYAYYNGLPITENEKIIGENYIKRSFSI